MNENQNRILAEAKTFVTEIFQKKVNPHFIFHNLEHTKQVVAAAEELANHYQLNDQDRFILFLAAWFHDTGFASNQAEEHEKESSKIATEFLQGRNVEPEVIQRVSSCVQATRMPQSPLSLVEKITCDADLYHLGTKEFKKMNELLKQEQEAYFKKEFSKREWRQRNIEFLEAHQYFTDYCQQKLEPTKQVWLKQLRKKQGNKEVKHTEQMEISPYSFEKDLNTHPAGNNKDGKQNKETERGIQTIFRTTSNNHIQLSEMADNKANIMISVNSIILTVMFSIGLLGRLVYFPHLIPPTLILIVVCITAMIFAILSTRPSITSGRFTEDDIRNKQTNLLFFGNFHKMEIDEYHWGMTEMLKDREYMYGSMIKDIYFLGVVLARKYRFLRISYNVFMYGLIISAIAYTIASLFFAENA